MPLRSSFSLSLSLFLSLGHCAKRLFRRHIPSGIIGDCHQPDINVNKNVAPGTGMWSGEGEMSGGQCVGRCDESRPNGSLLLRGWFDEKMQMHSWPQTHSINSLCRRILTHQNFTSTDRLQTSFEQEEALHSNCIERVY